MSKSGKEKNEKTLEDIEFQLRKLNQNIFDLNGTLTELTKEIGRSKTPVDM